MLQVRAAFSRDQAQKVYVQHLIAKDGKKLWEVNALDVLVVN